VGFVSTVWYVVATELAFDDLVWNQVVVKTPLTGLAWGSKRDYAHKTPVMNGNDRGVGSRNDLGGSRISLTAEVGDEIP